MKSDINEVQRNANKYNLGNILLSSKKNKKYMIKINNKTIYFGDSRYEDYTYHHDENKRKLFRTRNAKWANMPRDSPAWMSYNLLWN